MVYQYFDMSCDLCVLYFLWGDIMHKRSLWISFFLVACLPGILASMVPYKHQAQGITDTELTQTARTEREVYFIRLQDGNQVTRMDIEDYVCGVLMGEMPASFSTEALKAQAVAARTYTLRKITTSQKHPDAELCTDPGCCQAFIFAEQYNGSQDDIQKITGAVEETRGEILTYEGELIDATYYSSSGGRTEAAVAVWGTDIPYLQAKDSPGEEEAKYYRDEMVFTQDEIMEKLDIEDDHLTYSDIAYTEGGGVESIKICDKNFSGTQIRNLLGLRSTAFSIEIYTDNVVFITKGYGHRVGMSQYGAQAMAQEGSDYTQILFYYYPNTKLESLDSYI